MGARKAKRKHNKRSKDDMPKALKNPPDFFGGMKSLWNKAGGQ